MRAPDSGATRLPLTRALVLEAAIRVADAGGFESVTMRRLGQELGVEAMSLYNHVANKEAVLDGMVDLLVSEIEASTGGRDWKASIRRRAIAARSLLKRHPWAPALITSRSTMSPGMLGYMDAVMGTLLAGGLSRELTHNAMHVIGSRVLGFSQELFRARDLGPEDSGIADLPLAGYPSITEVLGEVRHDDDVEFLFGLDLILDAIDRASVNARQVSPQPGRRG